MFEIENYIKTHAIVVPIYFSIHFKSKIRTVLFEQLKKNYFNSVNGDIYI